MNKISHDTSHPLQRRLFSLALLLFLPLLLPAQVRWAVEGKVTLSGQPLEAVTVTVTPIRQDTTGTKQGTTTDQQGHYRFTLVKGSYRLRFSYLGCQPEEREIEISQAPVTLSIALKESSQQAKEIVIEATVEGPPYESTGSTTVLSKEEMKSLPALLGEPDPLKLLQLTASVTNAGEGKTGLFIRGGNSDQTRVLFNEAPIYNPNHFLGVFSVFNPSVTDKAVLMNGGVSPEYGNALASVLDVQSSTEIPDRVTLNGSLGIASSRLHLEIPSGDNFKMTLSVRRSHITHLIKPIISAVDKSQDLKGTEYDFSDYNMALVWNPSARDKLSLHAYTGDDAAHMFYKEYGMYFDIGWSNQAASLQWQHLFDGGFTMNQLVTWSAYKASTTFKQSAYEGNMKNRLQEVKYKGTLDYATTHHFIKGGYELTVNQTLPNDSWFSLNSTLLNTPNGLKYNNAQTSLFVNDDMEWEHWRINAGVRANWYGQFGPYDRPQSGTRSYDRNELMQSYIGIEPRLSARYLLTPTSSVKASLTRHIQYLNMISLSSSTGLPVDYWIPATRQIRPQTGWLSTLGYYSTFATDWQWSGELYYKTMHHILENGKDLVSMIELADPEESLYDGKGWAYGMELSLKKEKGIWRGWISYALSWNWRKYAEINDGKPFAANTDQRHDLSVVGIYEPNAKWRFSSSFVYTSGKPVNVPVGIYMLNGIFILEYGKYHSQRIPAYHHLDLSATRTWKYSHGRYSELNLSFFNVYLRKNPFLVYFGARRLDKNSYQPTARKGSLFPIMPSISWTFNY
jgi:hypothetical protein